MSRSFSLFTDYPVSKKRLQNQSGWVSNNPKELL